MAIGYIGAPYRAGIRVITPVAPVTRHACLPLSRTPSFCNSFHRGWFLPSSILARCFLNPPLYQKNVLRGSTYYLYLPYLVHTVNIHGCTSYSRLS